MKRQEEIILKNTELGGIDIIAQHDLEIRDWGLVFLCDDELSAYRAAYAYGGNKYGVEVKFAKGAGKWQVTVYNETGAKLGFSNTKGL